MIGYVVGRACIPYAHPLRLDQPERLPLIFP
jgi:hypothetical protein